MSIPYPLVGCPCYTQVCNKKSIQEIEDLDIPDKLRLKELEDIDQDTGDNTDRVRNTDKDIKEDIDNNIDSNIDEEDISIFIDT